MLFRSVAVIESGEIAEEGEVEHIFSKEEYVEIGRKSKLKEARIHVC